MREYWIIESWITSGDCTVEHLCQFSLIYKGSRSFVEGRRFTECMRAMQVVASWNLTGLDEAMADRLFAKVKVQTRAAPQPESLKMTYLDEWLLANVLAGSVLVDEPKV
jgi:hypothetical protein